MQRDFTTSQLLRLAVQRYGELLGIEKYYERVKRYEWRIKNASDRSEKWQAQQLEIYRAGIKGIEEKEISPTDALRYTYLKQTRLPKPRTKPPL